MSRITHVDTSPSLKRHKSYHVNPRYYISNLPDDVLSHILSRLPTKDAVKTCVLSKDWEFKWTSIYNVNFNTEELSVKWRWEPRFVNIVERVLVRLQNVRSFYLSCSRHSVYGLSLISTLISAILRCNIMRLQLEINNNHDFFLPDSLLNCTSLTELVLKFEMPCSLRVPFENCFPNLKSLSLRGVKILNVISNNDTLVFTFPVLKVLELIKCKWGNVKFVEIHAPSLCAFTSITPYEFDDKKDFEYSIKVVGATLAKLETNGGYPEHIILIGSTVAYANMGCIFDDDDDSLLSFEEYGLQVRKLLREFSNVKYLSITYNLQAVAQTPLGLPLPRFLELKKLYLNQPFDSEGVLELLHAAPFLKFLEIILDYWYEYDYDSVETLPSCVVHHLEEVTFDYTCCRRKPEYLFEKFLLKNGAQLKSVYIKGLYNLPENKVVEKYSSFPIASPCLEIVSPLTVWKLDLNKCVCFESFVVDCFDSFVYF